MHFAGIYHNKLTIGNCRVSDQKLSNLQRYFNSPYPSKYHRFVMIVCNIYFKLRSLLVLLNVESNLQNSSYQVLDTQTEDTLSNRKWTRRLSSIRSSERFQNPQPFGSYDMFVANEEIRNQKHVRVCSFYSFSRSF